MRRGLLRRRRFWLGLLIGIGFIALLVPTIRTSLRFRPSVLIGLSPRQVIDRCGDPAFASPYDTSPVWAAMNPEQRQSVLSAPEFSFGYQGGLGDRVSVKFRSGRAFEVRCLSK